MTIITCYTKNPAIFPSINDNKPSHLSPLENGGQLVDSQISPSALKALLDNVCQRAEASLASFGLHTPRCWSLDHRNFGRKKHQSIFLAIYINLVGGFFSPTTWKICMPKWKSSPNRHLKHTVWNHHPASVLHCKSPLFLLCPEVDSCPWVVFYLKLPNFDGFWCTPLAAKNQNPGRKNVAKLLTSSSPVVGPSWAYCRSPRWPVRGAGLQNWTPEKTWNSRLDHMFFGNSFWYHWNDIQLKWWVNIWW